MLCLWLPFTDGTTKNQGLIQDGITTGVTPTFINDGKLGKCLNQGQIDMNADTTAKILNNQELTICFWLYVNAEEGSTTKRGMLFGNNSIDDNDNRKFSLFQYPTCNDLHLSWMNDSKNTTFFQSFSNGVLPSYKWTHVAITYENPKIAIYINGKLFRTGYGISNSSSFAYNTRVIWNNAYRKLNDFRIYNECLSPRQVKEISKGLVCHYSLGEIDGKIGGRNLLQHSSLVGEQLICYKIDTMNSVTTKSYEKEGYHIVTPSTGNGNNGVGFKYTDFTSLGIKQGDTITFSCDIKGTSDTHSPFIKIHFSAKAASYIWYGVDSVNSVGVGFIPLKNKWQRISVAYTIPDTSEWTGNNMWLAIHGNFESDLYIKNLKLEKSSTATPWTPAPEDDASFYDNVIYDTSGYNNNGSVSGDILWDTNTPRYKGAYDFNGTGYIYNDNFNLTTTAFTISFWIKIPSTITHQHFDFATFNNWTSEGIGIYWDTSEQKSSSGAIFGEDSNGDKIHVTVQCRGELNEWTHFAIAWDGTKVYRYKNGIKFSESDFKVISVYHPRLWLGNSTFGNRTLENSESCMSDFRFYSTALSDADILDLYQASASVDNNGNLMLASEVIEE